MQDNAERARDLLAARREHSKGQGNFPTPEPHMGLRDERPEDREPRDLPKAKDGRTAPKGDAPVGQEDRNPDLVTRVPRGGGREPNSPGGMELVEGSLERPKREARPARPNARRSSAAKREVMREVTRDERPRHRGLVEPGTAAKDTEKNAKRRAGESRARKPTATPARAARTTRAPMQPQSRASGNTQRTAARARGSTKPLTKRAAKSAGPDATQSTAQGGKKASRRTSAGRGRAGRR
jgi:hypothetical protein